MQQRLELEAEQVDQPGHRQHQQDRDDQEAGEEVPAPERRGTSRRPVVAVRRVVGGAGRAGARGRRSCLSSDDAGTAPADRSGVGRAGTTAGEEERWTAPGVGAGEPDRAGPGGGARAASYDARGARPATATGQRPGGPAASSRSAGQGDDRPERSRSPCASQSPTSAAADEVGGHHRRVRLEVGDQVAAAAPASTGPRGGAEVGVLERADPAAVDGRQLRRGRSAWRPPWRPSGVTDVAGGQGQAEVDEGLAADEQGDRADRRDPAAEHRQRQQRREGEQDAPGRPGPGSRPSAVTCPATPRRNATDPTTSARSHRRRASRTVSMARRLSHDTPLSTIRHHNAGG